MSMEDIMNRLKAPFQPDEIEWRVGSTNKDKSKGLALAYVTNRAIQDRLDSIFGPFGWKNEFREWKGSSQICGISIKSGDEWITKWDGADNSNMEATKGGLSDAMKRAAYQWGIGRYLYKLPDVWVPLKDGKYLEYEPQLPPWALPEGYEYPEKKSEPNAGKLTDAQVNRAFAIAKKKGYTIADVKGWAIKKYKVIEISSLTKEQYDEFCKCLEDMKCKHE